MCSDNNPPPIVISAEGLGKCYHIYEAPKDRLKQFLARGKRRYYQEFWANRGIDLRIPRGETCGIIGRNGAGKTTLLQMIAGILRPTEGTLHVEGRVTSLLELGSGFNGDFTGRENVFLNGAVLGISRAEMEARFPAIEAFAEIGEFMDRPVKTYSSGMFVRLAFSVLANLDPDIFIVDEALAVGDAYFRHRCMRRFHDMREKGVTVIFVSHDAGSMKRLCDRVVWLDDGRTRAIGDPGPVVEAYLASLFGIEQADGGSEPPAGSSAAGEAAPAPDLLTETPRFDRRLGDQRATIRSVQLLGPDGSLLASVDGDREVVLRLAVETKQPEGLAHWIPGYILRNQLGEDLASTNSRIQGADLGELKAGSVTIVDVRIHLPVLAPSSYSLTPTLAYVGESGDTVLSDQLDNALVFEVTSKIDVFCLLSLETRFEVHETSSVAESGGA